MIVPIKPPTCHFFPVSDILHLPQSASSTLSGIIIIRRSSSASGSIEYLKAGV